MVKSLGILSLIPAQKLISILSGHAPVGGGGACHSKSTVYGEGEGWAVDTLSSGYKNAILLIQLSDIIILLFDHMGNFPL